MPTLQLSTIHYQLLYASKFAKFIPQGADRTNGGSPGIRLFI